MMQKKHDSYVKYGIRLLTAIVICFTVGLALAPFVQAEIVARYAFTTDASESINPYTETGALMGGASISGGSVVLDGVNSYVNLNPTIGVNSFGSSILANLTGNHSFETWVTWNGSAPLSQHIFDFGGGLQLITPDPNNAPLVQTWVPVNNLFLSVNEGTAGAGNTHYEIKPVAGPSNGAVINPNGPSPNSAYIVVTQNAPNPARMDLANKTLYINGVAVAAFASMRSGAVYPSTISGSQSFLGKDQGGDPNATPPPDVPAPVYFNGSISDVRVWNSALTAAEVLARYNNTLGADALAVWKGTTGDTFTTAGKWDTGLAPDANTTAVISKSLTTDLNGATVTVAGLSLLNGSVVDNAGTKGLLTSNTAFNVQIGTISANLAGTAGLIKSVADQTVILSGTNTFSGGVTINGGTLQLGNSAALGSTSNVVTINNVGSTLDSNGYNPTISGIVLTNGNVIDYMLGRITATGTFELQNGSVSALLGGTASLNKTTAGVVQLSGISTSVSNNYTGGTTVAQGTLQLTNATATLGSNISTNPVMVRSGARLEMSNSNNIGSAQDLTIETGAVATIDAINQGLINKLGTSGYGVLAMTVDNSLALNFNHANCLSPISLGAGGSGIQTYAGTITPFSNTFRLGGAGGTLNVSGPLNAGTGAPRGLIVNGGGSGGTVVLAGTNTYTGGTTVVRGMLQIATGSRMGGDVAGNNVRIQNTGTLNLAEEANIGGNQLLTINAGGVVSIAFPLTSTFLAKPTADSEGTVAVSSDYSDAITLTSGIALGAAVNSTLSGAITPYNNVYRFGCGGAVLNVTGNLTDGSTNSLIVSPGTGGSVSLAPAIGSNTYSGGTTINGGTLQIALNGLPTAGTVTVNAGTLNLGTQIVAVDRLVVNGGTVSNGSIATALDEFDLRSGTVSAALTDYTDPITSVVTSRNVVKSTPGFAQLSGGNTFTGKIYVNQGTLRVTFDGALGTLPTANIPDAIVFENGTQLDTGGFNWSAARGITINGTLTINPGGILRMQAPITGPGGLIKMGESLGLGYGGLACDYSGDTTIVSGWLTFGSANMLPYGPGKGNVYIQDAGLFQMNNLNQTINGLNGTGNIQNTNYANRNLSLGNGDANGDFSGTIGGDPLSDLHHINLIKVGTGTQILRNVANPYRGTTTISGGTLTAMKLSNGGSDSSIGISSEASTSLIIGSDVSTATATLKYIGAGDTTNRRFSVGFSAAFDASGTGPIQFLPATGMGMGYIGTGVHTVTLTGTNTGNNIMDVRLVDTGSLTNLVKSGSGKWKSTINHLYTGNTTVLAGELDLVDINTPAATVSVAAGGAVLVAHSITADTLTIGGGGGAAAAGQLTTVPEPATWAMLMLAAMGLGIYWRRGR